MTLMERARNLILQPHQEWQVIDAEPHTVQDLYSGYVMILAAIPAVCSFIGLSIIGIGVFGATYRVALGAGVAHLALSYLLSLAWVYVFALLIDALAPQFGASRNFIQALKVAAFTPTAAWLAGIFFIIPALAIIGWLLSLYSLYLVFVGLPLLMKSPPDKSIAYAAVVMIAMIVLAVVITIITGLAIPGAVRGF